MLHYLESSAFIIVDMITTAYVNTEVTELDLQPLPDAHIQQKI